MASQIEKFRHDSLLVTFDDAYLDNRTLAGASLRRHGISPIIFVATGYVEKLNRYWWVRINDILRAATACSIADAAARLNDAPQLQSILTSASVADWTGRRALRAQLAAALQSMPTARRDEVLDHLQDAMGIEQKTCLPLLTWSDMQEMITEGFEFGAHTVSHPQLTRLGASQIARELDVCSSEIERRLGNRPSTFAYPYGTYNDAVVAQVGAAGFRAAFTASPGVFIPGGTPALQAPRIQPSWSEPEKLETFIVLLKLSKYFPRALKPVLSKLVGEPFHGLVSDAHARN